MAAGSSAPVGTGIPTGVDAVGGDADVVGDVQVGRREPEVAGSLVAIDDHTAYFVRPTEHGVGRVEPTFTQRRSDRGRGHPIVVGGRGSAVDVDQLDTDHLETGGRAHRLEQRDIAPALVTEVEVLPHHHDLGIEAVDQHLRDEVLGRLLRSDFVEVDHVRVVDAGALEQFELLLEIGEQRRRGLRPHHRGRMAIEGDHRGTQTLCLGQLPHARDHRLVAAMDPVIGADRDDRAVGRRRARRGVANDLHRR